MVFILDIQVHVPPFSVFILISVTGVHQFVYLFIFFLNPTVIAREVRCYGFFFFNQLLIISKLDCHVVTPAMILLERIK